MMYDRGEASNGAVIDHGRDGGGSDDENDGGGADGCGYGCESFQRALFSIYITTCGHSNSNDLIDSCILFIMNYKPVNISVNHDWLYSVMIVISIIISGSIVYVKVYIGCQYNRLFLPDIYVTLCIY